MPEDPDRLDSSLDAALAEYGRCEPRQGLEGRVLATLRSTPRLPWWRALLASRPAWAAASVLVTVGSVAAIFFMDTPRTRGYVTPLRSSVPEPTAPAAAVDPPDLPPGPAVAEPAVPAAPSRETRRLASAAGAPRRPSFPHAAPLSEQELLLLRYLSTTPPEEIEPRTGFLDEPAQLPALPDPTTNP